MVEDSTIDPISKFYYQGHGFVDCLDGGSACHINLMEILSVKQYRHLMNVAVKAGCNYFTYNAVGYECNDCHHISKSWSTHCSKCDSENIDYITRVIGYLKKVSNFSEARQNEFKRRYNASASSVKKE